MNNKKIIIVILILWVIIFGIICFLVFKTKSDNRYILAEGNVEDLVVTVNGDEIKRLDVNYRKFINDNINKEHGDNLKTDTESLIKEVIKDKILYQEAQKNNITITETEENEIKNIFLDDFSEVERNIARKIGMNDEEFKNFNIQKQIESKITSKMYGKIILDISEYKIKIDNEDFNNKVKELKEDNSQDPDKKNELIDNAYESYLNYLVDNSDIKY